MTKTRITPLYERLSRDDELQFAAYYHLLLFDIIE